MGSKFLDFDLLQLFEPESIDGLVFARWQQFIELLKRAEDPSVHHLLKEIIAIGGDDFYQLYFRDAQGQRRGIMDELASSIPFARFDSMDDIECEEDKSGYAWSHFKIRLRQAQLSKFILQVAQSEIHFFKQHGTSYTKRLDIVDWMQDQFAFAHQIVQEEYATLFSDRSTSLDDYLRICTNVVLWRALQEYMQTISSIGVAHSFAFGKRLSDEEIFFDLRPLDIVWEESLYALFVYDENPLEQEIEQLVIPHQWLDKKTTQKRLVVDSAPTLSFLEAAQSKEWDIVEYYIQTDQNLYRLYRPGESPFEYIALNAEPTAMYRRVLIAIAEKIATDYNKLNFHLVDNTFLTFMGAFAAYTPLHEYYKPNAHDSLAYHRLMHEVQIIQATLQLFGELNAPEVNHMGLVHQAVFKTTGISVDMLRLELQRLHRKFILFHEEELVVAIDDKRKKYNENASNFELKHLRQMAQSIDEVLHYYQTGRDLKVDVLIQRLTQKKPCAFELRSFVGTDSHSTGVVIIPEKDNKNGAMIWITNLANYAMNGTDRLRRDKRFGYLEVYYTAQPETIFALLISFASRRHDNFDFREAIYQAVEENKIRYLVEIPIGKQKGFTCAYMALIGVYASAQLQAASDLSGAFDKQKRGEYYGTVEAWALSFNQFCLEEYFQKQQSRFVSDLPQLQYEPRNSPHLIFSIQASRALNKTLTEWLSKIILNNQARAYKAIGFEPALAAFICDKKTAGPLVYMAFSLGLMFNDLVRPFFSPEEKKLLIPYGLFELLNSYIQGITPEHAQDLADVNKYGAQAYHLKEQLRHLSDHQAHFLQLGLTPSDLQHPDLNIHMANCFRIFNIKDPLYLSKISIEQGAILSRGTLPRHLVVQPQVGTAHHVALNQKVEQMERLALKEGKSKPKLSPTSEQIVELTDAPEFSLTFEQILALPGAQAVGLTCGLKHDQVFNTAFTIGHALAIYHGLPYKKVMDLPMHDSLDPHGSASELFLHSMNTGKDFSLYKGVEWTVETAYILCELDLVNEENIEYLKSVSAARIHALKNGWKKSEVNHPNFSIWHVICDLPPAYRLVKPCVAFAWFLKNYAISMAKWVELDVDDQVDASLLAIHIHNNAKYTLAELSSLTFNQLLVLDKGWTLDEVQRNEVTNMHVKAIVDYGYSSRFLIGLSGNEVKNLIFSGVRAEGYRREQAAYQHIKRNVLHGRDPSFFNRLNTRNAAVTEGALIVYTGIKSGLCT